MLTSAVPPIATAPSHPRGPGRRRLAAALGGAAALALAGSLIAWQLQTAPGAPGPAAGTAAPPASRPATAAPATTRPASAARRPAASSAPATTGPAETSAAASSPAASTPASPAQVTIPNVVGLSFTSARLLLDHDGFIVVGRHTRLGQTVTGTSPSGHAAAGSVIMVFYGTGT